MENRFFNFRYPKELEFALEESLEGLKSTSEDEEVILQYSQWTLEFVSLALSGFKSKVIVSHAWERAHNREDHVTCFFHV